MRESIDRMKTYQEAMTDPRSGPDFQSQFVESLLVSLDVSEVEDFMADLELYIQHTPAQCTKLRDVLEKLRDVVKFAM